MGQAFEEAEVELECVMRRYAGRPRDLIVRLLLMALEREEIVSISYRHSQIAERLRQMPISEELRRLIEHAIVWIWKDEEMHTVYVRGALLRLGKFTLRTQAYLQQLGGALGGWAASVVQQTPWSSAPLSNSFGRCVVFAGSITGRVPKTVGKTLRYVPFRDFCLLNADLERASWLSWDRIGVLADRDRFLPDLIPSFHQVAEEEIRHLRVFECIAGQLDAQDHQVSENSAEILATQISEISDFLLPHRRRTPRRGRVLGDGGIVQCQTAFPAETPQQGLKRLLAASELLSALQTRSVECGKPISDLQVVIKTCFMLGAHVRDVSPIVDPVLICELVKWLRDAGCRDIVVAESRNIYDQFFGGRTVSDVANYFGLREAGFRLTDLTEGQVPHMYSRGMGQSSVGAAWQASDFRISFGKTRSHPIEMALLSLGNLEGVGGRSDEFLFSDRLAERTTALMMVLDDFPPHFALLDCFHNVPDGIVGMMGCSNPHHPKRFYAGHDAFAVDCIVARHLGVRNLDDSPLLRAACHWFGGWPECVRVVGEDTPIAGWRGPYSSEWLALLSLMALPMYVGGSGRGSLFVPHMDLQAFPLLQKSSLLSRCTRSVIQRLIGLRLP